MLVSERYNSANDARQQLHNTLVELDGELCHVDHYDGWEFKVRRAVTYKGKRKWAARIESMSIKDTDLTLQQFSLGYVNYNGHAMYLQRKPLRKWKQGFYYEYLTVADDADVRKAKPYGVTIHHIFQSPSIIDLYDNVYPSFVKAWTNVSMLDDSSSAWHKHWAFGTAPTNNGGMLLAKRKKQHTLLYKGKIVGHVLNGDVILNHRFRYLTEPFIEAMIHAT